MKKISKNNGFTLIELLMVVAIIGLLSSLVLISIDTARAKSRDTSRVQAIKQIQNALQLYFIANGAFPPGNETNLSASLVPLYISSIPNDPSGGANVYQYQALTSPTSGGTCNSGAICQSYHLAAKMEQGANSALLLSDKDGENVLGSTNGSTIDGLSVVANCGADGASTATDLCYDIVP